MAVAVTDRSSGAGHHRAKLTFSVGTRGRTSLLTASRRQIGNMEAEVAVRLSARRVVAADRPDAALVEIHTETNSGTAINDHMAATPNPLPRVDRQHTGRPDAALVELQTSARLNRLRASVHGPPAVCGPVVRDMAGLPVGARLPPSAISVTSVAGKK